MDDENDPRQNEAQMMARARMFEPLVWEHTSDIKIQSLDETRYEEAVNLIKHHYIKEDPMFASCDFRQDSDSVKRYLEMAVTWMKDTISICALSVRSGRLVGVAVLRINSLAEKTEISNRIQVLRGDALPKIMNLRTTLIKQAKIYENLNIGEYLKIYILSVHPSYEPRGVKSALIEAVIAVGRSLNLPAIFGIFTSKIDQDVAESLNLNIFSEIQYSRWIVDDEVVFDDPGIGNYSAALMGVSIPDEPTDEEIKTQKRALRNKKRETVEA